MKFQCESCKRVFVYAAKKTFNEFNYNPKLADQKKEFMHPGDYTVTNIKEIKICPYCGSLEIAEYVEPQPKVESAVQVDWAEVDAKLKEGYVIVKDYQKNATMFKYAKEEVSEK